MRAENILSLLVLQLWGISHTIGAPFTMTTPRPTTTSPPSPGTCQNDLDIVVLLDSSGSVQGTWNSTIDHLEKFLSNFQIGDAKTRIGIVEFSKVAQVISPLDSGNSLGTLYELLEDLRLHPQNGQTLIEKGLERAAEVFQGAVPTRYIPKVLVTFTDGEAYNGDYKIWDSGIRDLSMQGVALFVVAVRKDSDLKGIDALASIPSYLYIFDLDNSVGTGLYMKQSLASAVCNTKRPIPADSPHSNDSNVLPVPEAIPYSHDKPPVLTPLLGQTQSQSAEGAQKPDQTSSQFGNSANPLASAQGQSNAASPLTKEASKQEPLLQGQQAQPVPPPAQLPAKQETPPSGQQTQQVSAPAQQPPKQEPLLQGQQAQPVPPPAQPPAQPPTKQEPTPLGQQTQQVAAPAQQPPKQEPLLQGQQAQPVPPPAQPPAQPLAKQEPTPLGQQTQQVSPPAQQAPKQEPLLQGQQAQPVPPPAQSPTKPEPLPIGQQSQQVSPPAQQPPKQEPLLQGQQAQPVPPPIQPPAKQEPTLLGQQTQQVSPPAQQPPKQGSAPLGQQAQPVPAPMQQSTEQATQIQGKQAQGTSPQAPPPLKPETSIQGQQTQAPYLPPKPSTQENVSQQQTYTAQQNQGNQTQTTYNTTQTTVSKPEGNTSQASVPQTQTSTNVSQTQGQSQQPLFQGAAAQQQMKTQDASNLHDPKHAQQQQQQQQPQQQQGPVTQTSQGQTPLAVPEVGLDEATIQKTQGNATAEPGAFKCNLTLKFMHCHRDMKINPRPLPVEMMHSDSAAHPGDIGWKDFLPRFICECANKAQNKPGFKFWTIGIQNYHQCFSGPDEGRYDEDGDAPAGSCQDENGKDCTEASEFCAGDDGTNAVFTVITPEHKSIKRIEYD